MGFKNIVTLCMLIIACAIMVRLGVWQLDRLAWKTDIIDKLVVQQAVDPMTNKLDLDNPVAFQRGYVDGVFINKPSIHIAPRTNDGQVGYHVIAPFETTGGNMILINRGWVADGITDYSAPPKGRVKIAGYLQKPDQKNSFTPENTTSQNRWYWMDIEAASIHYNGRFYDRLLYLESPSVARPQPFTNLPQPRNKHAQYATFWFFMAGLLAFLSGLYWFTKVKNS